jgi:hypothetical protein
MERDNNGCGVIVAIIGLVASCVGIFVFATGFQSIWQIPIPLFVSSATYTPTLTLTPTKTLTPTPTKPPTKTPNPSIHGTPSGTLTGDVCGSASATIDNTVVITVLSDGYYSDYVDLGISSDGKSMQVYDDVGLGENIIYTLNSSMIYEVRVMAFFESFFPVKSCVTLRINSYNN